MSQILSNPVFATNLELANTVKFLRGVSSVHLMSAITVLSGNTFSFTEFRVACNLHNSKKENSKFAYYLKQLRKFGIIQKQNNNTYCLTFRGIKTYELICVFSKIANLSLAAPQDAMTKIYVNLEKNKSWLEPLIKSEVRQALKELKQE